MTTYTPDELQAVLRAHLAWLKSEVNGVRADLSRANLGDADLSGANLRDADLSGAYLRDVKGMDTAIMPGGYTFAEYKSDLVPALLTAGGKTLEEVAASWDCHSWENCPMAVAFSVHRVEDVPILYRDQARFFIQLFDARLMPKPEAVTK